MTPAEHIDAVLREAYIGGIPNDPWIATFRACMIREFDQAIEEALKKQKALLSLGAIEAYEDAAKIADVRNYWCTEAYTGECCAAGIAQKIRDRVKALQ